MSNDTGGFMHISIAAVSRRAVAYCYFGILKGRYSTRLTLPLLKVTFNPL